MGHDQRKHRFRWMVPSRFTVHETLQACREICDFLVSGSDAFSGVRFHGDIDLILFIAEKHGLLPLLAHGLLGSDLSSNLTRGQTSILELALAHAYASRLLHLNALNELAELFHTDIRSWCVLKGPGIAERFYWEPYLRVYGDLDILVSSHDEKPAVSALKKLGYEQIEKARKKHTEISGEIVFKRRKPPFNIVEIHRDLTSSGSMRRCYWADVNSMLCETVKICVDGIPIPVLSPVDQFISSVIHVSLGHQWDFLLHLLDIARMIPFLTIVQRSDLVARCRTSHISAITSLTLHRVRQFFPGVTLDPDLMDLAGQYRFLMTCLNYGLMTPDCTVNPWSPINRVRRNLLRALFKSNWLCRSL